MIFEPTFLLIATGKYKQWVQQCTDSINKYLPLAKIVLFTDDIKQFNGQYDDLYEIKHEPFPYVTLYRFHYFLQAKDDLNSEYYYFMDIDSKFVRKPDIQGDLVAVRHCAYYFNGREIPQERNNLSVFYNYPFKKYYGGGFFGGNAEEFWKMCNWCKEGIDKDLAHNIIPIHNDETAMNAYYSIQPPTLELSPDYHYPENDGYFSERCWNNTKPFKPTILLLDKFKKQGEKEYRKAT